jgi:DNA-binding CsgD family transcriptional regulator
MPAEPGAGLRSEPAASHSLVGRDREFAMIGGFLDRSATVGTAMLLVGEPGVGKTALLTTASALAQSRGITVVQAGGTEVEAGSFSGLAAAVVPLMAYADRLTATQHRTVSVACGLRDGRLPQPTRVAQAVLTLLAAASTDHPVVIIVDDVQWLDAYSAEVLSFVASRLGGSHVGLLAASRTSPAGPLRWAGMSRHDVTVLDAGASDTLLRSRFPALAPRVRQRLLDVAEGNPLALLELPPALTRDQRAARQDLPAVLPLSERLQAVFASRISGLPPETRELLLLAALDATADLRVLRSAAGAPVLDDLAPAERERLLHVDEEQHRVTFRHPLTRSAVVEMSTAAQRRVAHRALAVALANRPEHRARHLAASIDQPDEDVAAALEHCARQMIQRNDAAGAVAALTRAADLSPAPGERSRRMAAAAQTAARGSWQLTAVAQLLFHAQDADMEPAAALHVASAAAIAMANGDYDIDTIHRLLVAAIEANAGTYDSSDEGLMASIDTLSVLCLFGGRPQLWEPFFATLGRLTPAVPRGLRLQASAQADPAHIGLPVLKELDAAIADMRDRSEPEDLLRIPAAAVYADRLAGCRDILRHQIARGDEGRAAARATMARLMLWPDAFGSGRWDEAGKLAADALATCAATGAAAYAQICTYYLALLAAARGDTGTTDSLITQLTQWATPRGARLGLVFAWHVRALAANGDGDFETAYQNAAAISPAGTLAAYEATALWVCLDVVESAVRTNRGQAAQAHVAAMHAHGLPAISPRLAMITYGCAAIAAVDHDEANRLADRALAVPGAERWPFDRARVALACGERLHEGGAGPQARRHLEAALATFEELDARPWAQRTAKALRIMGVPCVSGDAEVPRANDVLTAQELQIAELAAAGYSNKQIGERLHLSHRTVSTHLYRLFPKLGVTSRAALRDALTAGRR